MIIQQVRIDFIELGCHGNVNNDGHVAMFPGKF